MTQQGTPRTDLLLQPRAELGANRIRTGGWPKGHNRLPRSYDGFFLTSPTDTRGDFTVHAETMRALAGRGCPVGDSVVQGVRSLRAIPIDLDITQPLDVLFPLTKTCDCPGTSLGKLLVKVDGVDYLFTTTSRTSQIAICAGLDLASHRDPSAAAPWLWIEDRDVVRGDGVAVRIRVATIRMREWGRPC